MREKRLLTPRVKTLAIIFFIVVISAIDYSLFREKTREVELYDRLVERINSVKTGIINLEYLLDMYVVERRFEDTTVSLIKKDVTRLGGHVKDVVETAAQAEVLKGDTLVAEEVSGIRGDWTRVQEETSRLNEAMTQEEVILLHNAVDVNTILISERSERLLGMISEKRSGVFRSIKALIAANVSVFIVVSVAAAFLFQRRILRRLLAFSTTARGVSGGASHLRFAASGLMGDFARDLNAMLEALEEEKRAGEEKARELSVELERRKSQVETLGELISASGRSLSRDEALALAIKGASREGNADACAIYFYEDGNLALKASIGFDDFFLGEGSLIPAGALRGMEGGSSVFSDLDSFPYERYGKLLRACGFKELLCLPISYEKEAIGYIYAASRSAGSAGGSVPFFEAVASDIGVFTGYMNRFHGEHGARRFIERVVNQMPFGIAVFDRSGACVLLNNVLRKLYGVSSGFDCSHYNIADDEVFKKQGILTSIQKSYEGFTTEFVVNYNPTFAGRFMFAGRARKFKIISLPLYDQRGEISHIVLLFEGFPGEGEAEGEAP